MKSTDNPDAFHFSTDALPERDRIAVWREVFGRYVVNVQFEPVTDNRYFYAATLRNLPGISLAMSAGAGFRAERTRQMVAQGGDDVVLTINTEGLGHATQLDRETTITPFEGVLQSSAEPGGICYPDGARFLVFRLPRKTIGPIVGDLEARLARRLPQTEALRLLAAYSIALDTQPLASPILQQACATHLVDLVTIVIGSNRDAIEVAKGRGLQAVRLKAIKGDILARLSNEGLSVTEVASLHRVTPRYVQLLFEAEGMTFSEYVVEQRLERAYRTLMDKRFAEWTIGAIAFEVGFSNLSYFNRVFRRRYGATPSDVREAARRNH